MKDTISRVCRVCEHEQPIDQFGMYRIRGTERRRLVCSRCRNKARASYKGDCRFCNKPFTCAFPNQIFCSQRCCKSRPKHAWFVAGSSFGAREHPSEHTSWRMAIQRCHNETNKDYGSYGGRGITVCAEWRESFMVFLADMGSRPPGKQLDRIDNNEGYNKSNCRWTDRKTNCRNRRDTVYVVWEGKRIALAELAEKLGLDHKLLRSRVVDNKWDLESAIAAPILRVTRKNWAVSGDSKCG